MQSEKTKGNMPEYAGEGVAVWVNTTKDGKPYLTIQLLGKSGLRVNAFKIEPKAMPQQPTQGQEYTQQQQFRQ